MSSCSVVVSYIYSYLMYVGDGLASTYHSLGPLRHVRLACMALASLGRLAGEEGGRRLARHAKSRSAGWEGGGSRLSRA